MVCGTDRQLWTASVLRAATHVGHQSALECSGDAQLVPLRPPFAKTEHI